MQAVGGISNDRMETTIRLSFNPVKAVGVHHRSLATRERLLPSLQLAELLLMSSDGETWPEVIAAALLSDKH
jgi:hypothetical protein